MSSLEGLRLKPKLIVIKGKIFLADWYYSTKTTKILRKMISFNFRFFKIAKINKKIFKPLDNIVLFIIFNFFKSFD